MTHDAASAAGCLIAAGLGDATVADWRAAEPQGIADFETDCHHYSHFWDRSAGLLLRLPPKSVRNAAESAAAQAILTVARGHRETFLAAHAATVYDRLTRNRSRFVRLEELVYEAPTIVYGLTPTRKQMAAESTRLQRDKDGLEVDQGLFLAHVLANERSGLHLCHAMLLPRPEPADMLAELDARGRIDLDKATIERQGKAAVVTMTNPRYLNAEDETTLDLTEIAVDLAILDPGTDIAVVRGGPLDHPKYRGRRVFGAGINLTHLYRGQIPFLWFMQRDMGYVHKMLRGVARPEALPDDVSGTGIEKPWIAAVDSFAIGGHCQILLAVDHVVAADDAFLSLPARKEGIIPGLANLRLPRFTGDRLARQLIQHERKLACDSAEARLICDEVVPAGDLDNAIAQAVAGLTNAGAASTIGNRRALRIGQEPLDLFRRYCAAYARDQAYCCFSPALISNLERNWDARNRKP